MTWKKRIGPPHSGQIVSGADEEEEELTRKKRRGERGVLGGRRTS